MLRNYLATLDMVARRAHPLLLVPTCLLAVACNRAPEPPNSNPTPTTTPAAASASAAPSPAPRSSVEDPALGTSAQAEPDGHHRDHEFERPRPPNDNPSVVRLSHILIAYKGAQAAGPKVTRSKEEAHTLAGQVALQGRVGVPFDDLIKKFSDDPKVSENKGDLGKFTRDQKGTTLADAGLFMFPLEVWAEPVETPTGFHILKRTE